MNRIVRSRRKKLSVKLTMVSVKEGQNLFPHAYHMYDVVIIMDIDEEGVMGTGQ